MSDSAVRQFGFEPYIARDASAPQPAAGVTLTARGARSMWNVRGARAAGAFAVALPVVPNTVAGDRRLRALWLGPDEWLVVSDAEIAPKRAADATFVDVGHGRAVVRLSGPHVRDALAKGCAIDLDARQFPVNACAQTAIAKIHVILDHVEPGVFDLYWPRSYAGSLWHWLTEAAAEYACVVTV